MYPDDAANEDNLWRIIGESALLLVAAVGISFTPWLKGYGHDIIAGALLVIIGRVIPPVLRLVLHRRPAPKWLISIAFIVGAGGGFLVSAMVKHTPNTILYISPVRYLSTQGFYSAVVDQLIHQGGDNGFQVTVWLPTQDFEVQAQHFLIDKAIKEKSNFAAIVFTPFKEYTQEDMNDLYQHLVEFQPADLVIFDMDIPAPLRDRMAKNNIPIPPCVKGDEKIGGELAARALLEYFSSRGMKNPTIAVFNQTVPKPRSVAFLETIAAQNSGINARTVIWLTRSFTREEARQIALTELPSGPHIDAIFAGNDASALGVRDALMQLRSERVPAVDGEIKIVGYDATGEVIQLLQDINEKFLLNTVDVEIPDQVTAIIRDARLFQTNRSSVIRQPGDECTAITPKLFR
jgi:DNA-binding LacI/PurR family transcriptional regulator